MERHSSIHKSRSLVTSTTRWQVVGKTSKRQAPLPPTNFEPVVPILKSVKHTVARCLETSPLIFFLGLYCRTNINRGALGHSLRPRGARASTNCYCKSDGFAYRRYSSRCWVLGCRSGSQVTSHHQSPGARPAIGHFNFK